MALGVRGSNPIWSEVDLTAKQFDDSFWLYVLENTIPYAPAMVWHDPDFNQVWTNPIQFLANGTLPIDIFFLPEKVYRLEFRQNLGLLPPSQNDPLIYEVNNYVAGSGGATPVDTVALASTNQITNPQFSMISFASPFTLAATNPDPIEVAPGWFLELAGTGTVTLTQVPLNNTNINPSNAPYALQITINGWNNGQVFLRQRFQQNGMLWANKFVSSTLTARLEGAPQPVTASLIDSNGATLAQILDVPAINEDWNEFTGYGELGDTTNPNTPPAAYIDYKLALPSNIDIYVTSFQLVVQELPIEPSFEQDSIDRQIDHTFHYYKESLLRQSKESILTGWDFALNPWQFKTTTITNLPTNSYTADQTIVVQQLFVAGGVGNNIAVGRASAANNFGYEVDAVTATNQFAMIQYIDPRTARASWNNILSSLVRLNAVKQNSSLPLRMKMRLIYRTTLPPTISQTQPISSWAASGEPAFTAGWTAITPKNDPVYNIVNGFNEFDFESFQLPAQSGNLMTLGIALYTIDNMTIADNIIFDQISLAQSDFAIETTRLTFDETLRRCQYYYAKSFENGVVPGFSITTGEVVFPQTVAALGNGISQSVQLPVRMRVAPTVALFNPVTATALVRNINQSADCTASATTAISESSFGITYQAVAGSAIGDGLSVQWTANSQLGA